MSTTHMLPTPFTPPFARAPSPGKPTIKRWRRSPTIGPRRLADRLKAWSLPAALLIVPAAGRAGSMSEASFTDLAQHCGASVAPTTLAAIAKTESNFRPYIVSDNTTRTARDSETPEEAVALADRLIARGHSVDLGMMQINSHNLRRLGYTTRDALDACKSVAGGAWILSRNFASNRGVADAQIALRHALSQYNTGNNWAGYRNGYVRRVEQAARSLRNASTTPVPTVALAHAAGPITRGTSAAGWNVWDGVAHSTEPRASLSTESYLVF